MAIIRPFLPVDRARSLRRQRLTLGLAAVSLVLGCDQPTGPSPPREISSEARAHLDEVIDTMRARALHRLAIDWAAFRTAVFAAAPGAQTVPETFTGIKVALGLLRDRGHSYYITTTGGLFGAPVEAMGGRLCYALPAPSPPVQQGIGYVRVGGFTGSEAQAFAQSIQDAIRLADREGLVGWIVDLRGNIGGNMWPMLAGLGPVLGEGTVGYFVGPAGERNVWSYSNGASLHDGTEVVRVPEPYRLRAPLPLPRVAVLFDGHTASSGEAMVLAFRGRPGSRSFGAQTCGVATGVTVHQLGNGAILGLATVWMADRTGTTFPTEIQPDEPLPDSRVVARAIEWLTSGQE